MRVARSWQTKAEAKIDVFTYIEGWHDPRRLHSSKRSLALPKSARLRRASEHAHLGVARLQEPPQLFTDLWVTLGLGGHGIDCAAPK